MVMVARPVLEELTPAARSVYEAALQIVEDAADPANAIDAETLGLAQNEVARWELTPDADADEGTVLLLADEESEARFRLGPAPLLIDQVGNPGGRVTGEIVSGAIANFSVTEGWFVQVDLHGGSPGSDDFNALATLCFTRSPSCPSANPATGEPGRIAIEIDGLIESAPLVKLHERGALYRA